MWDPFREIEMLDRRMNRLIRGLWGSEFEPPKLLGAGEGAILPAPSGWRVPDVDVKENDNEITVTAEMPGIKKEDIEINIHDNYLELKAETREEKKEEKEGYVYKERRLGSYHRSLPLPANVNADKAKAAYKDGVLTLTLPNAEKVKKTKIEIK